MKLETMMACLVIATIGAVGCGVDDQPLRPRGGAGLPAQSWASWEEAADVSSLSEEELAEVIERQEQTVVSMVRWPEGKPGERDALSDVRSCRTKLRADDSYREAHPIEQFIRGGECMESLGWVFDPDLANASS